MQLSGRRIFGCGVAGTLAGIWLSGLGCSRSPLRKVDVTDDSVPYTCQNDAECRGTNACESYACVVGLCQRVRETTCDDGNPCTDDGCNPVDGTCQFAFRTNDDDSDGYRAALPGKTPGAADACGNDCNDSSPLSHPGASELCDGVDNDCNGIIDDTQRYYGPNNGLPTVFWVSDSAKFQSYPAGMAYDGSKFAITTGEQNERWQGVFHALASDGTIEVPATTLTSAANDSAAGPLVWTGSVFGTAWEDRRETSYDIYFNRLDGLGKKLHPDLRVTASMGFSIEPSLVYSGTEWLLAYSDDSDTGDFTIYTQRISQDATLIGLPTAITPPSIDARQPRLSKNSSGYGLFYYSYTDKYFAYQKLDTNLAAVGAVVPLEPGKDADVSIRWNGDRYILTWAVRIGDSYGPTIWAMSVDDAGRTLGSPRPITIGAGVARSPSIVGLGDRFMLLWTDDRYSPKLLELSMQTFLNDFSALDVQQQITTLDSDSLDPVGVLGGGALGILFRSHLSGPWHTYFTALRCLNLTPP